MKYLIVIDTLLAIYKECIDDFNSKVHICNKIIEDHNDLCDDVEELAKITRECGDYLYDVAENIQNNSANTVQDYKKLLLKIIGLLEDIALELEDIGGIDANVVRYDDVKIHRYFNDKYDHYRSMLKQYKKDNLNDTE